MEKHILSKGARNLNMANEDSKHATTSVTSASENLQYFPSIHDNDGSNYEYVQIDLAATHRTGTSVKESDEFIETDLVPADSDFPDEQHNEERTISNLNHQITTLQERMNIQIKESENKMQMYEKLLLERENDIFNLKHRINEEIEEKNNLKSYYSDETSKLNNEINELEQKSKDNMDRSRQIIEAKIKDIQILQEQKLSLLQSLTNEISKLNNIVTKLKSEIKIEQQLKQNVKDWYEYKLMKLNEKVLNRNNELVELQDGIFGKGETIENLQIELKKERERSKKLHDDLLCVEREKKQVENILKMQTEEMLTMQRNYEQKIASISNDTENTETSHYKEGCESKKICITETRKRLPLQDSSNFNDSYISHSKEKHNIQISPQ